MLLRNCLIGRFWDRVWNLKRFVLKSVILVRPSQSKTIMKFFSLCSLVACAFASVHAAAVNPPVPDTPAPVPAPAPAAPSNSTDVNNAPPAANTTAAVPPPPVTPPPNVNNNTNKSVAEILNTCTRPHTFTRREKKEMNDVLAVLTLLLQFQLFVNPDRSKDNVMYNELLPVYREAKKLFKNMNLK